MLSERPYRKKRNLGEAAAELSWLAPAKPILMPFMLCWSSYGRDASRMISPERPGHRRKNAREAVPRRPNPLQHLTHGHDQLVSELNRRVHHGGPGRLSEVSGSSPCHRGDGARCRTCL